MALYEMLFDRFLVILVFHVPQRMQLSRTLEKIGQNHTKTICWKCAGFVMVFSEKPSLFIKTI